MKSNWKEHKQVCGIYCIQNTINKKCYIGKSVSIARRIHHHIYELNHNISHCTKLQRAWNKYKSNNFIYHIIEVIEQTIPNFKSYIADREVYWIDYFDTINDGYNLKRDSSSLTVHHPSTIDKFKQKIGVKNPNFGKYWPEERKMALSNLKKQMIEDGKIKIPYKEIARKGVEIRNKRWKENPELIQIMVNKCNLTKIKYEIHQLDKQNSNLIRVWKDILELINAHPEYKKHNIYAVCSGEKPSMYGFKWKKVLKK